MLNNYSLKQKAKVKELEDLFNSGNSKTSIVEIKKDYENDRQITLTSVVFLPKEITDAVTKNIIEPLKKIEPNHYFYPPASMHLTIKNVRTIQYPPTFSDEDVEKVNELFNNITDENYE